MGGGHNSLLGSESGLRSTKQAGCTKQALRPQPAALRPQPGHNRPPGSGEPEPRELMSRPQILRRGPAAPKPTCQ